MSRAHGSIDRIAASRQVVVEAPAKVNLYLEILGRRPDGYHEIDTVMQTVSLADTVSIRAREDGAFRLSLRGETNGVPADGANLVIRAAHELAETLKRSSSQQSICGADIELEKRIPPGSGLGGGSSDAAATLVGLRGLWKVDAGDELLAEVAATLGSDIPFFVRGGAARCSGRGEIVESLGAEGHMYAVLVFGEQISTGDVYREYEKLHLTYSHKTDMLPWCRSGLVRLADIGDGPLRNALEPAAFNIHPELRECKDALVAAGASQACLSGSGSCVYGVCESALQAEKVASQLAASGNACVAAESVGPRCE